MTYFKYRIQSNYKKTLTIYDFLTNMSFNETGFYCGWDYFTAWTPEFGKKTKIELSRL